MGKQVTSVITYLEMHNRPTRPTPQCPVKNLTLLRTENIPLHFYRYLYHEVGKDYVWVDRKKMADEDVTAIIHDPLVDVYAPLVGGCPAGIIELDFRIKGRGELSFFGLMPEFVGLKLGGVFAGSGNRYSVGLRH